MARLQRNQAISTEDLSANHEISSNKDHMQERANELVNTDGLDRPRTQAVREIDPFITSHLRYIGVERNGYSREEHPFRVTLPRALHDTFLIDGFSLDDKEEVRSVARLYAQKLNARSITQPLERLLLEMERIPNMQGMALAIWTESGMSSSLSLYPVMDLSKEAVEDPDQTTCADAVEIAYDHFLDAVEQRGIDLDSELTYFNTRGEKISALLPTLPQELAQEEFMGMNMVSGSMYLLAIARVEKEVEQYREVARG